MVLVISGMLCLPVGVNADDQERKQAQDTQSSQQKSMTQAQDPKMMYGWELMTVKEREEHQAKMRSLKTEEERTAYRQEHHKQMQQRAKEQGVTIPDEPAQRGSGAGSGGGQGAGSGRSNQ
jgi:1,2-phenylacetyl-CoA epoxidase catalytic subunit